jgi:hypothetical protein
VTVDYYSSTVGAVLSGSEYLITASPSLTFTKRETFGYSLNGKEFVVGQGQPYSAVQDSFAGTSAKILGGTNTGTAKDGSNRPYSKAVNTGWATKICGAASDLFSLWGMASAVGSDQTDTFTLSLTYYPGYASDSQMNTGRGSFDEHRLGGSQLQRAVRGCPLRLFLTGLNENQPWI